MMKKLFTDQDRDLILALSKKRMPASKISIIIGCGVSSVENVIRANKVIASGDIERVQGLLKMSRPTVQWACRINGVDYDSIMRKVVEEELPEMDLQNQTIMEALKASEIYETPEAPETEAQNTEIVNNAPTAAPSAEAPPAPSSAPSSVEAVIRECTEQMNAALKTFFESLIDCINVNTDIQSNENKKILDTLNGIKMNTKKKDFSQK